MLRKTLVLLGALKILLLTTPVMASETAKEKFYVYGRSCKAVALQGTFETIDQALEAAAKFRGEGMTEVSVRTGAHDTRDDLGTAAAHYEIYFRGLPGTRTDLWLHVTAPDAAKAKETADQLKKGWQAVEIVPHYGRFSVFGGNCSRSIGLRGTYESATEAIAAARKCRNDGLKHVTVRIGEGDYFGTDAKQYQVYRRGCKGGWYLHATVDNSDMANKISDELKSSGRREVEIVLNYASPKSKAP